MIIFSRRILSMLALIVCTLSSLLGGVYIFSLNKYDRRLLQECYFSLTTASVPIIDNIHEVLNPEKSDASEDESINDCKETPYRVYENVTRIVHIHFPKCGTSFARSMQLYHGDCSAIYDYPRRRAEPHSDAVCMMYPWTRDEQVTPLGSQRWQSPAAIGSCGGALKACNAHPPLTTSELCGVQILWTLLRDPAARLLSAFRHGRHAYRTTRKDDIMALPDDVELFASFPGVSSCMVKMMTGSNCGEDTIVDTDRFQLAEQRLAQLHYIGLTEEWDASICLLHQMYGGITAETELLNVRPGEYEPVSSEVQHRLREIDHWDTKLWESARVLFATRLKKNPCCIPKLQDPSLMDVIPD